MLPERLFVRREAVRTMTDETNVRHGVDTEALGAFAAHAAENPEAVQFELAARSTYEGTCAHSLAKVDSYTLGGEEIARPTREYTIPYGAWREVLDAGGWVGATDRLEPIEAALSALASCINVGISVNAVANGVDFDDLETKVSADFDPAVLFGLDDLDAAEHVFENVTADVEIGGDQLDKTQVHEWARRAPVFALVSLAQDVDLTVNARSEIPADD